MKNEKKRAVGRPATGRNGQLVTFNCHNYNIHKVKELQKEKNLSKTINKLLANHQPQE